MRPASATTDRAPSSSHLAMIRLFMALAQAGFRRYATYRQAMVAAGGVLRLAVARSAHWEDGTYLVS